jgi:RimJ/RimL family protein N-acetyltransferase
MQSLQLKPYVRGKTIFLREVIIEDAELILKLRSDPQKNKHISATDGSLDKQRDYITRYKKSETDYYFIISDWERRALGTIRIYDICGDSFCWGSWVLSSEAPLNTAIESALLVYDFAFFSLHYPKSHFDVRKENARVIDFHKRFGASVVSEDEQNLYFEYSRESYLSIREKYRRFLP